MKLLRTFRAGQPAGYAHWCPGCGSLHEYRVEAPPHWKFDGNISSPTFTPSMRSFVPERKPDPQDATDKGRPERTLCHYHLVKGVINYLPDSAGHQLRGKHPLQEVPENYGIPPDWKPL